LKAVVFLAILTLTTALSNAQDMSLIDSAMIQVGMSRNDIHFDQDEMAGWGGDTWRLSYFTMFHKNPLKLPKYGLLNLEAFTVDCGNITNLVSGAGRKIDCPVRRGLIDDPLIKYAPDSASYQTFMEKQKLLPDPKFKPLRNKIDLIYEPETLHQICQSYQETGQPVVLLSALDGRGLPELLRILVQLLSLAGEPELSLSDSGYEAE